MIPNREELAWAAGLFDCEGCVRCYMYSTRVISVSIGQNHPEVLERFRHAVGGIGIVYISKRNGKDYWTYRATRFEEVQAVIAYLWVFLSSVKQEDAKEALQKWHDLHGESGLLSRKIGYSPK